MHGAGIKTGSTKSRPPARLLDVTRLVSRAGLGPMTGIDRVEAAYLRHLIAAPEPLFTLTRTAFGYVLLDQSGTERVADALVGKAQWGRADLASRLYHRSRPARGAAESGLRRHRLARCSEGGLARMLATHLPAGTSYVNVGHTNLTTRFLAAIRQMENARITVMVHDTIPLDFPEYARPGGSVVVRARLTAIQAHADMVLCNSDATAQAVQRHVSPPTLLRAHLGIDAPPPNPPDFDVPDVPYFLTVGTLEGRKNHALLLDIWEELHRSYGDNTPQLVLAGRRGWANGAFLARLDASPLRGRFVHECNNLTDAQIAALYRGCRAVLFPSVAEGFGLPLAEAAACGAPVVALDLPVYREFLGNYPVYVKEAEVYSWLKIVERMFANREEPGGQKPNPPRLQSWGDHFETVLGVI